MKDMVKEWKTSELLEFLNSYNRVFREDPDRTKPYQTLYVLAFAELQRRSALLSLLY